MGDLINKWPKSFDVVEYVRFRPNTFCVMWNHELFSFSDKTSDFYVKTQQKYPKWIESLKPKVDNLLQLFQWTDHVEWLLSLPHIIEQDDFIVVHAWLHPEYGMNTPLEFATLVREHGGKPWYEYYTWDKLVIYGHWAAEGLRVRKNTIWLDTWCCFGWALTAYCIDTKEFYQVRAHAVYETPKHWNLKK